jgi:hypothetical protein
MEVNISYISNQIKSLFDISRQPAPEIPGMLMAVGCKQKPGLSSKMSLGNIVRILDQHEIPTDPLPDGTENKTVQVVLAIVDEIYRAIKEDANIQVAHEPGAITIMASGANSGGPVVSQGINVNFSKGQAIIQ